MNKKLLAVAVASALGVPATALAQITISGVFKVGIDQFKVTPTAATAAARLNTSQMRISDNSSQIHFNLNEDLGGGLAAIAKLDLRFRPDEGGNGSNVTAAGTGTVGGTSNPIGTGNTWVGLRSSSMGQITLGRHDMHYGLQPNDVPAKGALMASSVSLMDYVIGGTAATSAPAAIATASRTQNSVMWVSPNWSGFSLSVGYSTSPLTGSEGDMSANTAAPVTKGTGTAITPVFNASNWQVGASIWDAKSDNSGLAGQTATANSQKSTVLYGFYRIGGWKIGGATKTDERKNALTGVITNDRSALTINGAYFMGPHTFAMHYTTADQDDAVQFAAMDTKAKMTAFAYSYDLSKRTAVSVTWAKIDNNPGANYNFFTNTSLGSGDASVVSGEDLQLMAFTLRHAF
jgi:predicted porin